MSNTLMEDFVGVALPGKYNALYNNDDVPILSLRTQNRGERMRADGL